MDLAIRHVYTVHIICMSCIYTCTCVLYRWARPCEAHPLQLRVWDHSITHFLSLSLSLSLRSGWNLLQELIQSRQKKLAAAYEIHRFNRDARESLGRLKVRDHSFSDSDNNSYAYSLWIVCILQCIR